VIEDHRVASGSSIWTRPMPLPGIRRRWCAAAGRRRWRRRRSGLRACPRL